MIDRRHVLLSGLALGACGRAPGRQGGDVVAAGQPAALLIWALAPHRLAGWPRRPSPAALAFLDSTADLPELGALNASARPADLEAIAALKPRLILDYGDTEGAPAAALRQAAARLGGDVHVLDGALARSPSVIREAAVRLGANAGALAKLAEDTLARWSRPSGGPSFYYARGLDGLETGFSGSLATQVLEGHGWSNVATSGRATIGRVTAEQLNAWDPDIVVTLDRGFASQASTQRLWRRRRNGAPRRLLLLPDLPFGWLDRPPSLNRLIGCAWLAGGNAAAARVAQQLYRRPLPASLRPQWLG